MEYVEIYNINDGKQKLLGKFFYDGKVITWSSRLNNFAKNVKKNGIFYKGKFYFPKDGLKFLKYLKYDFSGSYIRASDIMEGD